MKRQTIVYKIARNFKPDSLESSNLIILIFARENPSESIQLFWYYNAENPDKWQGPYISAAFATFDLYELTGIRDVDIIEKSSPEEVVNLLENQQLIRAFHINVKLPDQKDPVKILITEKEKETGWIRVKRKDYGIPIEVRQQLEEMKAKHHIAPPKS